MRANRRAIYRALVTASAALAFTLVGYFGGQALIDLQNRSQLRNLSKLLLHRAEVEADFALTGLGNLAQAIPVGCTAAFLGEMRRQVYVRSSIKDIRVVDDAGMVVCSAFPETLSFDVESGDPTMPLPARNPGVGLVRLSHTSSASLGVVWRTGPRFSLLAVANTDAVLFGVLPAGLSSDAQLRLELANGDVVASFQAGNAPLGDARSVVVFTARSERYPLVLTMVIEGAALALWQHSVLPYYWAPAGLFGLVFGGLLAWLVVPRRTLLTDIDDALAAGEIVPFVQPVVALASREVVGCEVLARWIRKDGSVVPPNQFIPQIEQSGRARLLTWTLLRRVLIDMRDILVASPDFTVAMNIVPSHFLEPGFAGELRELVSCAGIDPRQIILELTERQELTDLPRAADAISELGVAGFAVAIDDAGTGHSGLTYVQSLGAQILKLDKFFVDAMETSHSARVVVEMLVGAAQQLGMNLVAEGIEQQSQLTRLKEIGIKRGQGYLFGRPVPVASFLADFELQRQPLSPHQRERPAADAA